MTTTQICNGDCITNTAASNTPTLLQDNAQLIIEYNVAKLILDARLRCTRTFMHDATVPFVLRAYVMMHKAKVNHWIYNFTH